jgi:hypothetical protein
LIARCSPFSIYEYAAYAQAEPAFETKMTKAFVSGLSAFIVPRSPCRLTQPPGRLQAGRHFSQASGRQPMTR